MRSSNIFFVSFVKESGKQPAFNAKSIEYRAVERCRKSALWIREDGSKGAANQKDPGRDKRFVTDRFAKVTVEATLLLVAMMEEFLSNARGKFCRFAQKALITCWVEGNAEDAVHTSADQRS